MKLQIPLTQRTLLGVMLVIGFCSAMANAQPATNPATAPGSGNRLLIVGTKPAPPFAIHNADGSWSGLAIDLWREAADNLGYHYQFKKESLDGLLQGVKNHSLDAAVAAITITGAREAQIDFTQPYFVTGLGIAVPSHHESGWARAVGAVISGPFLKAVVGLFILLLVAGLLVWFFEHRRNPDQFAEGALDGIMASFWWAAVTMTTVGYGDKAPQSLAGRIVGIIWMFTGVIVISSFTAAITSTLTIQHMQGPVQSLRDLSSARVGAVQDSTSAEYLAYRHIAFVPFASLPAALAALHADELDAVVHDAPILQYEANRHYHGQIHVLPETFDQQYYGIALPSGSARREPVDRQILQIIHSPQWRTTVAQYLGAEAAK